MDLFTPLPIGRDPNENLLNYIKISSENSKNIIREWSEGFIDRDNKFLFEFQTSFEGMLWELYCYAVLKKMGCSVDFSYNRPDFVVNLPYHFLIECTVAREGQGMPKENDIKEKINPSYNLTERTDYATVRLFNSINSKFKKYQNGYGALEHVINLPYIVAVAPFEQARFQDSGMEPIRKILWGQTVQKVNQSYFLEDYDKLKKNDDVYLNMGIFINDSYQEVSGILFSNLATIAKPDCMASDPNLVITHQHYNPHSQKANIKISYTFTRKTENTMMRFALEARKQVESNIVNGGYADRFDIDKAVYHGYREKLTDGLHLFLNPFAKNPLADDVINMFYSNGVSIHRYNIEERYEPENMLIDNHLMSRVVNRFNILK